MTSTLDLSRVGTGAVVAPAGHGKTHAIGQTVAAHPELRILVLTHTNAGIVALMHQTGRRPLRQLRLETIASFTLKIVQSFPSRGGWWPTDDVNFDDVYAGALLALQSSTVLRVITGSFDLIIVDEYQDCNVAQAAIIDVLATRVRTVVVGDPLQGIYDFGTSPAIQWDGETSSLPLVGRLSTPHRWSKSNPALGQWLSEIRPALDAGQVPDIDHAIVEVVRLDKPAGEGGLNRYLAARKTTAVITANSGNTGAIMHIARAYQGRVRVAEAAEFKELRKLARRMDTDSSSECLVALIEFAAIAKTGVSVGPVRTLKDKLRSQGMTQKSSHPCVVAANAYLAQTTPANAGTFFRLVLNCGIYTHRPELPALLLRAFAMQQAHPEWTVDEAVSAVLERRNHIAGSEQRGMVVGSTLRLKGLEFDTVIVLNANEIKSSKHLYVALSRATRRLVLTVS